MMQDEGSDECEANTLHNRERERENLHSWSQVSLKVSQRFTSKMLLDNNDNNVVKKG